MNYFAYRLPDETKVHTGASALLLIERSEGVSKSECSVDSVKEGFTACEFEDGSVPVIIPADEKLTLAQIAEMVRKDAQRYPIANSAISKREYTESVNRIKREIAEGKLMKCVLCRKIISDIDIDIEETFHELCRAYPKAFVFLYHIEGLGIWMGASPELLLKYDGKRVKTMALAGTKVAGSAVPWDKKNIEEQRIVKEYIEDVLKGLGGGSEPSVSETMTLWAGPVEHLCTQIEMKCCSAKDAQAIARKLSPTPALSGMPRETAFEIIREVEQGDRGCYGGYCGPREESGKRENFSYYVNLRSMQIGTLEVRSEERAVRCEEKGVRSEGKTLRICQYSGGGIMGDSDADAEWEETERKATTVALGIRNRKLLS